MGAGVPVSLVESSPSETDIGRRGKSQTSGRKLGELGGTWSELHVQYLETQGAVLGVGATGYSSAGSSMVNGHSDAAMEWNLWFVHSENGHCSSGFGTQFRGSIDSVR